MSTRVWQELEYRADVSRVTRGAYVEHLKLFYQRFAVTLNELQTVNLFHYGVVFFPCPPRSVSFKSLWASVHGTKNNPWFEEITPCVSYLGWRGLGFRTLIFCWVLILTPGATNASDVTIAFAAAISAANEKSLIDSTIRTSVNLVLKKSTHLSKVCGLHHRAAA